MLTRRAGDPAPEPRALMDMKPIGADAQRGALLALSASLLAGDGRFGAARALLRRDPPRQAHDPDDLVAATLTLDREVLPVQGPPGTGKTYRGARMIVAALRDGKRVGIDRAEPRSDPEPARRGRAPRPRRRRRVRRRLQGRGLRRRRRDRRRPTATCWRSTSSSPARPGCSPARSTARRSTWSSSTRPASSRSPTPSRSRPPRDSVVLLGDPQQLPQVTQAAHPGGSGASVLEHLLDGEATIPPERGVLLTETWRMHPDVCAFVSERSYDDRLARAQRLRRTSRRGGGRADGRGSARARGRARRSQPGVAGGGAGDRRRVPRAARPARR